MYEKALAIRRRRLGDDHPDTAAAYNNLATHSIALGNDDLAQVLLSKAVNIEDASRLRVAFAGLERVLAGRSSRTVLASVLARLGRPGEGWQRLEEHAGRGLLDELAARGDRRLTPAEREELKALVARLATIDRALEAQVDRLDQAGRAARHEHLKRERQEVGVALGELQERLVRKYGPIAGQVASLAEVQADLPDDVALVAWVDRDPVGPGAADPDGDRWGVVARSKGAPTWVRLVGSGPEGRWTEADRKLPERVRERLAKRPAPGSGSEGAAELLARLRAQRLRPLEAALGATADGLPAARRLIVLPSSALAGLPIEALLAPGDRRAVSYAPSATVLMHLRRQPRTDPTAGLLAVGDPIYPEPDKSGDPAPAPNHGLLVIAVAPGSNAADHGLKPGDVLLAYRGQALRTRDDFKVVPEGEEPVPVEVWREGRSAQREVATGKLGVVFDSRPAAEAIADQRRLDRILLTARSGSETFKRLPGTRVEVEALTGLFASAGRPARALLGDRASEAELEQLVDSGALGRFGYIHLATHGVVDPDVPGRSAVILTQAGLPDPLQRVLEHQPVFDGRLTVREIQHAWELHADLVTLSACRTGLGRAAGGEGFIGFTQSLLMSGARSVCLSLWEVDDASTALLMRRFYANLLGREGLGRPLPKAEALAEAKTWLRDLTQSEAISLVAGLTGGVDRDKGKSRPDLAGGVPPSAVAVVEDRPYAHPYYWAAFVLVGDPD